MIGRILHSLPSGSRKSTLPRGSLNGNQTSIPVLEETHILLWRNSLVNMKASPQVCGTQKSQPSSNGDGHRPAPYFGFVGSFPFGGVSRISTGVRRQARSQEDEQVQAEVLSLLNKQEQELRRIVVELEECFKIQSDSLQPDKARVLRRVF